MMTLEAWCLEISKFRRQTKPFKCPQLTSAAIVWCSNSRFCCMPDKVKYIKKVQTRWSFFFTPLLCFFSFVSHNPPVHMSPLRELWGQHLHHVQNSRCKWVSSPTWASADSPSYDISPLHNQICRISSWVCFFPLIPPVTQRGAEKHSQSLTVSLYTNGITTL